MCSVCMYICIYVYEMLYFVSHKCSIAHIQNCKSAYQANAPRISHQDALHCCILNNMIKRTWKELRVIAGYIMHDV